MVELLGWMWNQEIWKKSRNKLKWLIVLHLQQKCSCMQNLYNTEKRIVCVRLRGLHLEELPNSNKNSSNDIIVYLVHWSHQRKIAGSTSTAVIHGEPWSPSVQQSGLIWLRMQLFFYPWPFDHIQHNLKTTFSVLETHVNRITGPSRHWLLFFTFSISPLFLPVYSSRAWRGWSRLC